MNTTTRLRRRNVAVVITVTVLLVSIGLSASNIVSIQNARGQKNTNMTGGMMGGNSNQNKASMMMGTYGPNITGSVALGPTIAKATASQVHVSLANASMIAEKAVGGNAHAAAVRIGAVHGFLVYIAFVVDSNNNFHGVLVDPGNGKVLSSSLISMAALMLGGMGMMGPGIHQGMMTHYPGMMSRPHP